MQFSLFRGREDVFPPTPQLWQVFVTYLIDQSEPSNIRKKDAIASCEIRRIMYVNSLSQSDIQERDSIFLQLVS